MLPELDWTRYLGYPSGSLFSIRWIDWILDFPKGEYLLGELEILGVDQEEIINLNELKLDEYGNRIFEEVGGE